MGMLDFFRRLQLQRSRATTSEKSLNNLTNIKMRLSSVCVLGVLALVALLCLAEAEEKRDEDGPCQCGMMYYDHMCKKGKKEFLESPHAAKRAWDTIEKTFADKRRIYIGDVGGEDNHECSCGMPYCDDYCKGKKEFLEGPHTAKRVWEEMEKLYEDKRTPYMGEDDRPCACGMIYCDHMCKKGKREFLESPHTAKRVAGEMEKLYVE